MSWVITAIAVTGATVGATAQYQAGKADEIALEQQAEQEELAAEGRELQRRQRLNKVLAANVVSMADAGIKSEGTPEAVAMSSAEQASLSEGIESLSTRLRAAQLRRQGRNAAKIGALQAAGTLLQGSAQAGQTMPTGG